jgi:D-glycero-D-manno-heptose 1,7-bisphosphate phosphatase
MSCRPTIFLDKDGTVVRDIPYNVRPELIELAPYAAIGLPMLYRAGYQLVIVSNQSGVARGLFDTAALIEVERQIRMLLSDVGAPISGFYYCPHHPQGTVAEYAIECRCRKPQPGLLQQAARDLQVAMEDSWMIGDILNDVEAAHRAGCRALLLLNGGETEWDLSPIRRPNLVTADLAEAARRILAVNRYHGRAVVATTHA